MVIVGAAAGAVVSLLILTIMAEMQSDSLLGCIFAFLPLAAGAYLGNRWRGRVSPHVVRVNREELTVSIPGRGLLRLVHTDPAKVEWTPETAVT